MGKINSGTGNQGHINDVHAQFSAKEAELMNLVLANVDKTSPLFAQFQTQLSTAMTTLLQCPVK